MALTKIDDRGLKTPIDLLDNEKIRFGTDIDLQIYSDNSNAIITAAGAGDLQLISTADDVIIQAADNIFINPQGGENGLKVYGDGAVKLYYDGSTDPKLETTANGIQVSNGKIEIFTEENPSVFQLHREDSSITTDDVLGRVDFTGRDSGGVGTERLGAVIRSVAAAAWDTGQTTGYTASNIDFHTQDNSGTDTISAGPRMRIDSSGKIGIGETSPSTVLHLKSGSNTAATLQTTNNGSSVSSNYNTPNRIFYTGVDIGGVNSAYTIYDGTASAERMRIDSSGRLLLGTTTEGHSTSDDFTIATTDSTGITIRSAHNCDGNIYFSDGTSGTAEYMGYLQYNHTDDKLSIGANAQNKVQVLANGNVNISDGDLVIGTSGHGIDFSATSDASGMSSELLDSYEEGSWSQTATNLGDHTKHGDSHANYTKVGDIVTAIFFYKWTGRSTNNGAYGIKISLPFTAATLAVPGHGSCGCESIAVNSSDRTSFHTAVYSGLSEATFRASGHNTGEVSFNGATSTSASAGYFSGIVSYKAA